MVSPTPTVQTYQPQFQHNQQSYQNQQSRVPSKSHFDLIPKTYTELYLALLQNGLIKTRFPRVVPNPLPLWYKPEAHCDFIREHRGMILRSVSR